MQRPANRKPPASRKVMAQEPAFVEHLHRIHSPAASYQSAFVAFIKLSYKNVLVIWLCFIEAHCKLKNNCFYELIATRDSDFGAYWSLRRDSQHMQPSGSYVIIPLNTFNIVYF